MRNELRRHSSLHRHQLTSKPNRPLPRSTHRLSPVPSATGRVGARGSALGIPAALASVRLWSGAGVSGAAVARHHYFVHVESAGRMARTYQDPARHRYRSLSWRCDWVRSPSAPTRCAANATMIEQLPEAATVSARSCAHAGQPRRATYRKCKTAAAARSKKRRLRQRWCRDSAPASHPCRRRSAAIQAR